MYALIIHECSPRVQLHKESVFQYLAGAYAPANYTNLNKNNESLFFRYFEYN